MIGLGEMYFTWHKCVCGNAYQAAPDHSWNKDQQQCFECWLSKQPAHVQKRINERLSGVTS